MSFSAARFGIGMILGMVSLGALSSCGFKSSEEISTLIEMKLGATACLNGGSKVLAKLSQGKASEEEVSRLWDCTAQSLRTFTQRTRGQRAGVYTPDELRSFLQRYFLKETKISDALLAEIMELKRTLVGGRADLLTVDEIDQARQFILVMKGQVLRIRTFFPLTPEEYARADEGRLRDAVAALEAAGLELGRVLKGTGYDYQLSHLEILLRELEAMSSPSVAESFRNMRENLPTLRQLKAILIAPGVTHVGGDQWEYLFAAATRAYGLTLRYAHGQARDPSWSHGIGRESIVNVAQDVLELLGHSAQRYPGAVIPFEAFDQLIDQLGVRRFQDIDVTLSPEHLKGFLRPLFQRILSNPYKREVQSVAGLTPEILRRARDLIEEWSEGQGFLDLLFDPPLDRNSRYGNIRNFSEAKIRRRSELLSAGITDVYGKPRGGIPAVTWAAASRLRSLIAGTRPFFGNGEEIQLVPVDADPNFSYRDLTFLNLTHFLGRLLVAVYAKDKGSGVTVDEFGRAYHDFREIGIDFKLFDPAKNRIYVKRFLEANLFTFAGDGDEFLNDSEVADLLSYLNSSKQQGRRVHGLIASLCNFEKTTPIDFFGQELVDAGCYRHEFFGNHALVWRNAPGLKNYYASLKTRDRAEFERNLEETARSGGVSDKPMDSTDTESLAGLSHYIETLFLRFDRDGNGQLSEEEAVGGAHIRSADAAYPVFKGILSNASCKVGSCLENENDLQDLFTYLLAHGEVPGKWEFIGWKVARPFVRIRADRGLIVKILSRLVTVVGSAEGFR